MRTVNFAVYGPTFKPEKDVQVTEVLLTDHDGVIRPDGEVIEVRAGSAASNTGVVIAEGPREAFTHRVQVQDGDLVRGDWIEVRRRGGTASAGGRWIFYCRRID